MNHLPLTEPEVGAVALTMLDLGMLHPVEGVPAEPTPPSGRESECLQAQLGMPTVRLDDELRGFLEAYNRRISWHPASPAGISAHKLATPGWVISIAETRSALTALDSAGHQTVRSTVDRQFARVDREFWEDWVKLLRGSADAGLPVLFGPADYEGPWAIAEILLESDYRLA
ncbi:hypothetical protein ACIPJN_30060 [Streptomyces sp. NPDC086796]|uniref:hypothetical protein n=1 Tax=Streptomyces sp. NPDC086796 TaxID=3365760 RepID=UPI0037F23BB8